MTGSDLRPCFLRPEDHIAQILPNVHDAIGKFIFPIKSWTLCILELPYLGGCETEGDFDVTRNLGAFKVGNFMEFTKIF